MSTSTMIILLLVVCILAAVIWSIKTVNRFRENEIRIDEGISGIEVALTKRYDMLTKLLDASRGYMAHEKELFTQVVNLRQGMNIKELQEADSKISSISGRLFAVAENYPELRSSEVFLELQRGIREAEESLQAARRVYNSGVTRYNTSIAVFPASLLAGGRQPKDFFVADEAKRADVKISF